MYIIIYGGASFPIPNVVKTRSLREAISWLRWLAGQYTFVRLVVT